MEVFADNKYHILTHSDYNISDDFFKIWASEDINLEINQRKNILAISKICASLDVSFVYEKSEKFNGGNPDTHNARDLMHPGPVLQKEIADHMFNKLTEIAC